MAESPLNSELSEPSGCFQHRGGRHTREAGSDLGGICSIASAALLLAQMPVASHNDDHGRRLHPLDWRKCRDRSDQ